MAINLAPAKVVAVDLDGTLTFSDTLHEAVISLVSKKPFLLFILPFWLFQGIAYLKQKVAAHSDLDVTTLPYNQPLIDWLKDEKLRGKKIVISSVAGDRVRACNYVYGSAKAMMTAFTSGLRQRLYKSNVSVITVKPGFVDTPMTSNFKKGILWVKPDFVATKIV